MTAFQANGDILILYYGWSDSAISPLNTVNYYESVLTRMGRRSVRAFVRLYMVPGMQHCGGDPGPSSFGAGPSADANPKDSMFGGLDRWVEHGAASWTIIATKYANPSNRAGGVEMTRPLCPYPEVAKYKGRGNIDQAASFVCTVERSKGQATVGVLHPGSLCCLLHLQRDLAGLGQAARGSLDRQGVSASHGAILLIFAAPSTTISPSSEKSCALLHSTPKSISDTLLASPNWFCRQQSHRDVILCDSKSGPNSGAPISFQGAYLWQTFS